MAASTLQSIERALDGLARQQRCRLVGSTPGLRGMLLARALLRGDLETILYVARDEHAARQLVEDVSFFLGDTGAGLDDGPVALLGEIDTSPYADVAADPRTVSSRMAALARMCATGSRPRLVVASLRSLTRKVMPRAAFEARVERWQRGQSLDRDEAISRLVEAGYERVEVVEDPGTYAVRGYVVDVFVPSGRFPVRLEWFGDELEQLRTFDPASQRSLREVKELCLHPAREAMVTAPSALRVRVLALGDELEIPTSTTRGVLDALRQDVEFFGQEALIPLMHEDMVPAWSYLGEGTRWIVEEPAELLTLYARMRESYDAQRVAATGAGQLTAAPGDFFVAEEDLAGKFAEAAVKVSAVVDVLAEDEAPADALRIDADSNVTLATALEGERGGGGDVIGHLAAHLRELGAGPGGVIETPWDVVLVVTNDARRSRLLASLTSRGVEVEDAPSPSSGTAGVEFVGPPKAGAPSRVRVVTGSVHRGFRSEEDRVLLLSEAEIFGARTRKHRRKGATRRLSGLAQLGVGDYVVHFVHGIGRYDGIEQISVGGVPGDFVLVQYAGSDRLFLPVHRVGEIERFSASGDKIPKLDKLGGHTFEARTRKVKADVRQLADELLRIYAEREARQGHAHARQPELCAGFEETFPFEETQDQLEAIEAVDQDLGSARPMDRIICGDVGFGKTEVALRAAFRVAAGGKQVAVLAPTTVLVQQHYLTFSGRFSTFPLRVGCLNRFQSAEEKRSTVAAVRRGELDVVVGTHRLLSADVRFADLGLVVIDEEQRFGVRQKERFKRLKAEVDVLTLTATPIPRTLHLSLLGLREISMLGTAPMDRLAVRTYLTRSSDVVLETGITRELKRGGQVFVVVPRVLGIEEYARRIRHLVPSARVSIAHGQMPPRMLEETMVEFVEHRVDVLVCTTIIESGLDIPRANTMFIERADMFGMAQLHQLRGRIGRGRLRAHCYLLVRSLEGLGDEAKQRLEAIARHDSLGAGFSVATRDLEVRGAGDILGKRQSGAIQAVGFEAYARLLEEAVAELRGDQVAREEETELNVDIPAFLPNDYVVDTGQRLDLYRRLARARDVDAVDLVMREIADRYGELPREADFYGVLMRCRCVARGLGAMSLELRGGRMTLRWSELSQAHRAALSAFAAARPGRLSVSADDSLRAHLTGEDARGARGILADALDLLGSLPTP